MASRGTILVADDDQATVDFIVEVLADEGYTAFGVSDSAAATAAILTNPPDLALVDLLFGGMSGLDVIQAVRAWGIALPIVIMTTQTPQAAAVATQGTAACLLKPFDLSDLLACVARHIRTDRPQPESRA